MKKLLFILFLALSLTGCSSIKGIVGENTTDIQAKEQKVAVINHQLANNTSAKLDEVSQFAYGVCIATNINTAHTLNNRIQSLAGQPNIQDANAMKAIVSDLEHSNAVSLASKDEEIAQLQHDQTKLFEERDNAVEKVETLSVAIANQSDATAQQLSRYHSFMGLGAIALGAWQFITTSIWILLGIVIVFFLLRALADINPIFGTAFSIFEGIGYGIIKCIEYFVPNAVQTIAKDVQAIEQEALPVTAPATVPAVPTAIPAASPVSGQNPVSGSV